MKKNFLQMIFQILGDEIYMADEITKEYIQFSKRITKWGITLVTAALGVCLILISIKEFPQYAIATINSLYNAYVTIMGITIGAYQGNSSIQKWTKAKYKMNATLPSHDDMDDSEIIEDIEDTYG